MDFEFSIQIFIAFLAGAISAIVLAFVLARMWLSQIHDRARHIIELAEHDAAASVKETQAAAKLAFEKMRAEAESQISRKRIEVEAEKRALDATREEMDKRRAEMEESIREYRENNRRILIKEENADIMRRRYRQELSEMSNLDADEAKEKMRDEIRSDCQEELMQLRSELLNKGEEQIKTEASRALVDVMQRISMNTSSSASATIVQLPNEDMKGRIIGREGRNIKAFETETGVTLMVDETPDQVMVSSFDPVRREVARIALEALVKDGRIHPASIEDEVHNAEKEIEETVITLGERALMKLRINSVHPEIVKLLGKLNFRLSNNQNTLEHSIEVAYLCSMIASELGLDPEIAKRAGLLHDIGKSMSEEYEGSHAIAAANLMRRYGDSSLVVNAVEAHHNEVPAESVYAGIVMVADGLSATRPGARTDTMDGYVQRVKSLEEIAKSFDGVDDAFAVQAGREIRVIVEPEKIDDKKAQQLTRKMRHRIEDEMQYPGQIKITVIRESRFMDVAK